MKRSILYLLAIAMLPVSATDYPAGKYRPYYGDVNGDGIHDIYLHATDSVVPIGVDAEAGFPIKLPPSLSSMLVAGTSSGFAQPQAHARLTETQIAALGLQRNKYEFHSGDFNEDGARDALLHGLDQNLLSLVLRGTVSTSPPAVPLMQVFHPDPVSGVPNLGLVDSVSVRDLDSDGDDDLIIGENPRYAMLSGGGVLGNYQQWDSSTDITYMAFNVRWPDEDLEEDNGGRLRWSNREKQIKNVIREHDPDVIAFQELFDRHELGQDQNYNIDPAPPADFLNEQDFNAYGKCMANAPSTAYSKPILFKNSKFELIDCKLYPVTGLSMTTPSSFSTALVRLNGSHRLYLLVNMHGPHHCTGCDSDYEQYLMEAKTTLSELEIDSGVGLILLGDMNMDWDDTHGRDVMWQSLLFQPLDLVDSFQELMGAVDDKDYFTKRSDADFAAGRDPDPAIQQARRIDHVFHSAWIKDMDYQVIRYSGCPENPAPEDYSECQQFASDHYPVIVTLRHYFPND